MIKRFLLIILLFSTATLYSETWYVAQSGGNDAFDGLAPIVTDNHGPFKTISHAVPYLVQGDTLFVRYGTYSEKIEVNASGTALNPIVIMAYENEIPTLTADSWDGTYALDLTDASFIHIQNFIFANCLKNRKPILLDNSHYNKISNCSFTNNQGSAAIHVFNTSSYNEISECTFTNTGNVERVWDAHIYLDSAGDYNRILKNTFTQSDTITERGVWCSHTSFTDISYNEFSNLSGIALSIGIEPDEFKESNSIPIENSVFDNRFNNNSGICCLLSHANTTRVNICNFSNNMGESALSIIGSNSTDNLVQSCTFWENGSPVEQHSSHIAVTNAGPGNQIILNNISGDPDNSGFEIVNSFSAIHVQNTNDITINENTISKISYPATIDKTEYDSSWIKYPKDGGRAGHGIYVYSEDSPLSGIVIENNVVQDCGASGLSLSNSNNGSVSHNQSLNNGAWGISVNGSHNIVEHNSVWNNGWMHGGCSGINIHGTSIGNIVKRNVSSNNNQGTAGTVGADWWSDGNGIIADQGADSTWIYNNICFGNEGAGIAITASKYCQVLYNTIVANGISEHAGYKAGLALVTTISGSRQIEAETIIGNIIYNNAEFQLSIADVAGHSHIMHHNLYGTGPLSVNNAIIHYRDEELPTYERNFSTIELFQEYWRNKNNTINTLGSLDGDPLLVYGNNMPNMVSDVYLLTLSPARQNGPALDWFLTDYYGRDRQTFGNWDLGAMFIDNKAPDGFRLMTPEDQSTLSTLTPELRWEKADDNDLGDNITYHLVVKQMTGIETIIIDQYVVGNSFQINTNLLAGDSYQWSVTAIDLDDHLTECEQAFNFSIQKGTGIDDNNEKLPIEFQLYPNFPNPFNAGTSIRFDLPKPAKVKLTIYDVYGRVVKELINRNMSLGSHQLFWNGTNQSNLPVSSGIYWLKLKADPYTSIQRMVLLK